MAGLAKYRAMRDFSATPEPQGGAGSKLALRYGIQMHDATRLHWDLRLEWDGVLLSWAVTRGPSTDPADKRLAVRTEDHPMDYLTFEGVIPKGYGAGTVMLWDIGWWQPFHDVGQGLEKGHLHFALHGRRATGNWSLIRMKGRDEPRENWLMIKEEDAAADQGGTPFSERYPVSAVTGRSLAQIAKNAPPHDPGPARKGPLPRFRAVQLAETVAAPPKGVDWLHEVKLDGYRAQIALGKGGIRIRTRNGHDWTDRFAELVQPLAELPCDSALIDGEIVAGAGLSGFSALQAAIKAGGPFRFYAFDLLHLDGKDLSDAPLLKRRAALEGVMADTVPLGILGLSPAITGDAAETLGTICDAGGEGMISKLRDAPYRGGRGPAWVKTKCIRRAEFVIVGWQPSASKGRAFASLLMATFEGGRLVYRGKVGTGFDGDTMDELAAAMKPLARDRAPLDAPKAETRGARWVQPRLVAEISHAELTSAGHLRHASFVALREDKSPKEVALDPTPTEQLEKPDPSRIDVAGVGISHPRRVIFPAVKVTKLDLARYYHDMADRILPHLADRPLSLVRLPEGIEGERFFQKHAGKGFPDAIRRIRVPDPDGGDDELLTVTDARGLVAAVQMGTVEFHPWGAKRDKPDRPERLVFDLDPDEGLGFAAVRDAAFELRNKLQALGLAAWPMLSGGKGVHVILPLRRTASWETARLFAQLFATLMAETVPDRYVATMSKRRRKDRIFIDWLRNDRGSTAIAPFSVRARPNASVAVPLSWDELKKQKRADAFGMDAARERGWDDLRLPAPNALNQTLLKRLAALVERDKD
ncbi:DNA ligase D [Paracoccus laeviglucosivorans]|uniref:DNA ligase (ATP) n=1 Tax=Paracoccus laeviglucosivorans TaxID=1197861 RepID=A0A521EJH2_9RHOB|nr:DNA ligase D [Paracoccus laeviglucosivorans]SMO84077.1 ATP-dependent DNA ligase LigD phosphoesterase module /ATP-dependent DNA ligase LigD polymerase module [Paracoccus laeviglucosivorans]